MNQLLTSWQYRRKEIQNLHHQKAACLQLSKIDEMFAWSLRGR